MAAAIAAPIPIVEPESSVGSVGSPAANGSVNANHTASVSPPLSTSLGAGVKQHRRLASTGKARRRLSDARDAANRPSYVSYFPAVQVVVVFFLGPCFLVLFRLSKFLYMLYFHDCD